MAAEIYDIVFQESGAEAVKRAVDDVNKSFKKTDESVRKTSDDMKKMGKTTSTELKSVEKSSVSAGKALTNIFKLDMAMKFASGVKSAFGEMISKYSEFTKQQAQVNTLLTGTGTSIKEVEKQLKQVSPLFGSIIDLQKGAYQAISASIDPKQIGAFMTAAGKAAKAGGSDITTAVDGLTSVINAYSMKVKDAGTISDTFFKTIQLGKTTFGEMAGSLGGVLPTAAQMGVSFDQVGAALVQMTKQGISTSEATTSLNAVLKASARLGLTNMIKTKGLSAAIQELQNRAKAGGMKNYEANLFKLTGRAEAAKAVFVLGAHAGADFNKSLKDIQSSAGATTEAFKKTSDTTAAKLEALKNAYTNLAVSFGASIAPALKDIADKLMALVKWFNSLSKGTKEFITIAGGIAGIVVMLTPVILSFKMLFDAIMSIKTAFGAIELASTATFAAVAVPATIIAGIIAWGDVLYHIDDVYLGLIEAIKEAYEWTKKLFGLQSHKPVGPNAQTNGYSDKDLQALNKINGSYARGTNYVPSTGLYRLHEGEAVLNRQQLLNGNDGGNIIVNINNPTVDSRGRVEQMVNRLNANFSTRRKEFLGV
jgi:TP901 family phage tail tape measure protein